MLSEESLELIVQDHLAELEWQAGHGPDFAPGSGERDTWNDIVLRGRLHNAVRNLNPGVPEEYLDQAIGEVITPKSQSAIAENRRIHQILVEGYRHRPRGQRSEPNHLLPVLASAHERLFVAQPGHRCEPGRRASLRCGLLRQRHAAGVY